MNLENDVEINTAKNAMWKNVSDTWAYVFDYLKFSPQQWGSTTLVVHEGGFSGINGLFLFQVYHNFYWDLENSVDFM